MLSPCIGICSMDGQSGLCKGCYRTLDEIAAWSSLTEEEREKLVADALHRAFENFTLQDSPCIPSIPNPAAPTA